MRIKLKIHGALAEYHCFMTKALEKFEGNKILEKCRW